METKEVESPTVKRQSKSVFDELKTKRIERLEAKITELETTIASLMPRISASVPAPPPCSPPKMVAGG